MSWKSILGTETILPRSGNSDEVIFESGKPKAVTLLLPEGGEPYSLFQHIFEAEVIDPVSGAKSQTMRVTNCMKTKENPYAECPLCFGQQIRRRVRHVVEVWDWEAQEAKILAAGAQVFTPIATIAGMPGTIVSQLQFVVSKTGQGRNDTQYAVSSMPITTAVPPTELRNIPSLYQPATVAEMQKTAESLGLVWESLITPLPLEYFTSLELALAHVVPNTKYKGQTMQAIYSTNPGMINFFSNSDRVSPEKAASQMILVAYEGAQIPGVPNFGNFPSASAPAQQPVPIPPAQPPAQVFVPATPAPIAQAPVPAPAPAQPAPIVNLAPPVAQAPVPVPVPVPAQPAPVPAQPAPIASAPVAGVLDKNGKIDAINELLRTNARLAQGGFPAIMALVQKFGNGKSSVIDFTEPELDAFLIECARP